MIADGYKDTEIGVIPTEWDVVKVGEILNVQTGKLNAQDQVVDGKYPFFTRSIDVQTIDTYAYDTEALFIAGEGNFKVKYYKGKFNLHQRTYMLTAMKDNNMKFLLNAIQPKVNKLISTSVGSTVQSLRKPIIEALKIPLPPLKEQDKIAEILSTADDKLEVISIQIKKAEKLKKGLLQKLLSEGIGHSKFKDSGLSIVYPMKKIPEAWSLKTLSEVTTKITDGAHFTPTYVESGIPFLRVTDLKSKDLLASEIKYIPEDEHLELLKRCKPEFGDILYSKNGTIGLTRIVNWDWEFSIFVSLCLIKPDRDLIIPEYLKYYLTSSIVDTQIKIRSKQGTVTNLHLEEIRDFFITIPPLEEQKQIADILLTADEKLEVLRAKKEKYEILKKALSQKLLSGEVRV